MARSCSRLPRARVAACCEMPGTISGESGEVPTAEKRSGFLLQSESGIAGDVRVSKWHVTINDVARKT